MKSKLALFAASFCTAALVGNAAVVINTDTASNFDGTYDDEAGAQTDMTGTATVFPLTSFRYTSDGFTISLFALDGATQKGVENIDILDPENPVTDGSLSGTFSVTGFDISYTYTLDPWNFGAGDFTFDGTFSYSATPVPEPSEYAAIAGAALIGFAAWRRGRSKVA